MLGIGLSTTAVKRPTVPVAIATMAAALRQAAAANGFSPNDTLISLMICQMMGAEGAMPGLWNGAGFTLRGTNNIGASQVLGASNGGPAFAAAHKNGWGGFAHKDSNPGGDNYLGWYVIAPTVYDAADHWLTGYPAVKAVLEQSPQDPQTYASIMYAGGYFTGLTTDSATEIGNYASRMSNVAGTVSEGMSASANDPKIPSVDTTLFDTLAARQITEDLYDKAMSGASGSEWKWLLPSWATIVKNNGVVWFGSPPGGSLTKKLGFTGTAALAGAAVGGPPGAAVGALAGYLVGAGHVPSIPKPKLPSIPGLHFGPPNPQAVQTAINNAGYQPPLTVDGVIGPLSQAGISWFQGQNGLPQTGTVDSATRKALGV